MSSRAATITVAGDVTLGSYILNHTASPFPLPFQTTLTSTVTTESRWDLSDESRSATGTDKVSMRILSPFASFSKTTDEISDLACFVPQVNNTGNSFDEATAKSVTAGVTVGASITVSTEVEVGVPFTETSVSAGASATAYAEGSIEGSIGTERTDTFSSDYSVGLSSSRESSNSISEGETITDTQEVSQTFGPAELPGCSLHFLNIISKRVTSSVPWTATMKPANVEYEVCSYEVSGSWSGASTTETYTTLYTQEAPRLYGACNSSQNYLDRLPSVAALRQLGGETAPMFPDSLTGLVVAICIILFFGPCGPLGALFLGASTLRLMRSQEAPSPAKSQARAPAPGPKPIL